MKIIALFFFTFTFIVKADVVPLPASVMGVDEIVEEFRAVFKSKIVDLGKNYITTISDQLVVLKSSDTLSCNGNSFPIGSVVTSFRYSSNLNANKELTEKAIYTGCNQEVSIVEDVVTKGDKVSPLSFSDFIKGKRSIDLKEGETFKLYKISNQEGDEIFKVLIEKSSDNSKVANFYYLGQKFLTIFYEYTTSSTQATFTVFSYSAKYVRKHGTWNTIQSFSPQTFSVLASKINNDPVRYFDGQGNRLSLSNFLEQFDGMVLSGTVARLRSILEYHTYYFPSTEVTSSGAQSQKLLEDLRIAQSRLTTNTELNLVKALVQDLINAAENGLIIDNRPKEQ